MIHSFSLVVVASVILTFKFLEINQHERISNSKNNTSSFIIASLTIVTIVVTITRSSNSLVLRA